MGTCHVLIHRILLEKISSSDQVKVISLTDYGEDDLFNVLLETLVLPDGYHGQQELILENNQIRFRRDTDT